MEYLKYEQSVQWLRSRPEYAQLVRDCYLDLDTITACKRFACSEEFDETRRLLRLPRRGPVSLIDIGAGNGIASYAFAMAGTKVKAIEPDPSTEVGAKAIRYVASKFHLPIEVYECSGEELPFSENSLDVAYCRQVLHHARDLGQMIAEIARVLKPGGMFLAVREHVVDGADQLRTFLEEHPLHKYHGKEHAYELAAYIESLRKGGLKIKKVMHQFDSVVNYAPRTRAEMERDAQAWACSRLGPVGRVLGGTSILQSLYAARRGRFHRAPGRLYAFLCLKPSR